MIFTGDMISADEAMRIGLVNKVCPQKDLMDLVLQTAGKILSKGRVSLRAAKQAINSGMDADLTTACNMEIDAFALCVASEDAAEGTRAFIEKRPPKFKSGLT